MARPSTNDIAMVILSRGRPAAGTEGNVLEDAEVMLVTIGCWSCDARSMRSNMEAVELKPAQTDAVR